MTQVCLYCNMPDEQEAPEAETTGTAEDQPLGMHEAYEAAQSALGITEGTGDEPADTPGRATETAPAAAGTTVEEPEHVRWAKAIEGDFDPVTGRFVEDRIVKRAFELNRQNQSQAQQIQQIRQALQDPEVRAAIQEARNRRQAPAAPTQTPPAEKTDEQILEEFVMERVNRTLQPVLQKIIPRVEQYRQGQVNVHKDQTYAQLREEFGADESGGYVYDSIAPQVAEAFDTAAQRLGTTRDELVSALVDRGQLLPTIRSIARDVDWQRQREAAAIVASAQSAAAVNAKRGTRLSPARGTPSGAVSQSKKINSIADAWEAAEAEIAQRA